MSLGTRNSPYRGREFYGPKIPSENSPIYPPLPTSVLALRALAVRTTSVSIPPVITDVPGNETLKQPKKSRKRR
jgi:hypothetical protein